MENNEFIKEEPTFEQLELSKEEKEKVVQREAFLDIAKSPLFLVFAIIFSVNVAAALFLNGDFFSSLVGNLISIFMLVGVWIIFGTAKKNQISEKGMKFVRVPFTISYIFKFIGIGFSFLLPIIIIFASPTIATFIKNALSGSGASELENALHEIGMTMKQFQDIIDGLGIILAIIGVFMLIGVAVALIYTILSYKAFKKAIQAGCDDANMTAPAHMPVGNAPVVFLIIEAVFTFFSFISVIISLTAGGSFARMMLPELIAQIPAEVFAEIGMSAAELLNKINVATAGIGLKIFGAFISGATSIAALVMLAIMIIKYNKKSRQA